MLESHKAIEGWITVLTAKGRLTFQEICTKMVDFTLSDHTPLVLCDMTSATVADLTTCEIEKVVKLIGRRIKKLSVGKAAIVVRGSVDFGLARMFSIFSEIADLPVTVRAFRNTDVAREWLSAGIKIEGDVNVLSLYKRQRILCGKGDFIFKRGSRSIY